MTKSKSQFGGFTLVEMMVVMIIIALAVALAVGVSADVRKHTRNETTRNVQTVLMQALAAYKHTHGEYPLGDGKSGSCGGLIKCLKNSPASNRVLQKLPSEALVFNAAGNEIAVDGFGREIKYNATGGLAGRNPALHSDGQSLDDPTDDIELGM